MICSNCGTANPTGAKFCTECATRLAVACPACGTANAATAKFCAECATPLGAGAVAPTAGARPTSSAGPRPGSADGSSEPVAERRLVSVLFADLVGFTPFAEERDAEDVRETLTRYFDLATEVIARYGGTVEKFIGDAVMAVWGAPTTREDDAERAVRAALELVDAVQVLGPTIGARAGVLTGEAAVTLGATNQGMVAGDLVNTASRLQSVASPGTVLVGEATQRAASRAIAFEAAGDQVLKGKAAPVPAWRALRVVAEVGGRNRAEGLEAPFVGRDEEFRLLRDLFHATGRERRVRLISVTGPAGIGKSRLAWEFLKYIDGLVETVWWHAGRCPAYGQGISFWALGEMVRGRCGLLETDDEPTTRAKVAATGRRVDPRRGRAALGRARPARAARARVRSELRISCSPPGGRSSSGSPPDGTGRDGLRGPPLRRQRAARLHRSPARPGARACRSTSSPWPDRSSSRSGPDWGAGKRNFVVAQPRPAAGPGDAPAAGRASCPGCRKRRSGRSSPAPTGSRSTPSRPSGCCSPRVGWPARTTSSCRSAT